MEKKYFQKQSSLFFNRLSLCPPSPRRFMRRAASEALEIGPLLKKLLLKQQLELQTKGLATRAMSNCRGISGVGGNTANIFSAGGAPPPPRSAPTRSLLSQRHPRGTQGPAGWPWLSR